MESQHDSREILCWSARTWALAIGWVQTIGSAILLLVETAGVIGLDEDIRERFGIGLARTLSVALVITTVIIWLIQFTCGIFLIIGVQQENLKKVTIWWVFTICFVPLTTLTAVWRACMEKFILFFFDIIGIPLAIFCLWAVNIYRKELLIARGIGEIEY